jgi:adhesin/invasin
VLVTASLQGGGTLGGTTTVATDGSGRAAFTDLVISGSAGTYTLTFSANGFASVTSSVITLELPAPPVLTLATQPEAKATSGVALDPQPLVQLRNGDGDALTTAGVLVTASLQGGGTLGGTTTVATDGSGRAAFTDLVITGGAGTYTLTFSANGFTSVTSDVITLEPPPPAPPDPSQSSVAPAAATVPVSQPVTITVAVKDAAGNPLSGRTVVLTASGSDNTITPLSQPTGGDGIASFSFSSTLAEDKTISATADGVPIGSTQVTVTL